MGEPFSENEEDRFAFLKDYSLQGGEWSAGVIGLNPGETFSISLFPPGVSIGTLPAFNSPLNMHTLS